jgi:hypothetical protein
LGERKRIRLTVSIADESSANGLIAGDAPAVAAVEMATDVGIGVSKGLVNGSVDHALLERP